MRFLKPIPAILLILASTGGIIAKTGGAILFEPDRLTNDMANFVFAYDDLKLFTHSSGAILPVASYLVRLEDRESIEDISFEVNGREAVLFGFLTPSSPRKATSADNRYNEIAAHFDSSDPGQAAVYLAGEISVGGDRYARLMLFPVSIDMDGQATFNREIRISVGERQLTGYQLLNEQPQQSKTLTEYPAWSASAYNLEYLIVTGADLVSSFERLADYRTSTGLQAEVKVIDEILASSEGRDDAEKLRNFLIRFYDQGGRYLLLAGDETVLPIRYAHHFSTDRGPSSYALQVCDLYFADLTGEWDLDNDGVWGESIHDQADLTPELRVGRLPFNTVDEAEAYIYKLIAYETSPGEGDVEYLNRAFFFSSDQMRDFSDGGQHAHIASAYPDHFLIDTVNGIEASSGADPQPTNTTAPLLVDLLSEGAGIVNIIAHGRSDGFAVRTSGYNNWPKSYFLTETEGTGHGNFSDLAPNGRTSFYYSLACDNGGFELDQPPYNREGNNLVQQLLSLEKSGAVAFVAYSRWGWIKTSHLLQKSFFDSLFAHPERPAIDAMYASKAVYYYYRDLNYGQNFYGDPAIHIYTDRPASLSLTVTENEAGLTVMVLSDGEPLPDCRVTLSANGQLIDSQNSESDGHTFFNGVVNDPDLVVTAVKPGYIVSMQSAATDLAVGVDDNDQELPGLFSLGQNFPNPFNPVTTIDYELTNSANVKVTVYNILGEQVRTLVDAVQPEGRHIVSWDGTDQRGNKAATGIYYYRLRSEGVVQTKKMLLLR